MFISWKFSFDTCQEKTGRIKNGYLEEVEPWLAGKRPMREHLYCTMFKLYRNSFCQQKAGLEPLLKLHEGRDPPSRFSISLLKFSDSHTKRKILGHLEEKVVGNCNHYITPAEVSTNLRRRPFLSFFFFFFFLFGLHQVLVSNSRNSVLGIGGTFF